MRKLLLATSAAALALAFSGPVLAEPDGAPATTGTIAPAGDHHHRRPGVLQGCRSGHADRAGQAGRSIEARRSGGSARHRRTNSRRRRRVGCAPRPGREQAFAIRAARAGSRRRAVVLSRPPVRADLDRRRQGGASRRAGDDIPQGRRGRRPRPGRLSDAGVRRSAEARRRRADADRIRPRVCPPRQHRPRRLLAGERRGLFRPEGAGRSRRAGQARGQHRRPRHASTATIRRAASTRR